MGDHAVMHYQNDAGHKTIAIGVKEFMCCGASAPYDHPHVFLDMGDDGEIVCPYCSTLYRFSDAVAADQTDPPGCTYHHSAA